MKKLLPIFNRPEMAILSGHNFPLAILRMSGRKTLGKSHSHSFYELVFIVSGRGTYQHDRGHHQLVSGDVFLVPPNEKHKYSSQMKLDLINIVWDAELLPIHTLDPNGFEKFVNLYRHGGENGHGNQFVNLSPQKLLEALNKVEAVNKELLSGLPCCILTAGCQLGELLAFLLRNYKVNSSSNHEWKQLQIDKALNYLQMHYAEKISRETLAAQLHISGSTFYRHFREITGQSFRDYLLALRLAHGENLLRNTSLPISEISNRIGYSDSNYFVTQFRIHFGVPPHKYRVSLLKDPMK